MQCEPDLAAKLLEQEGASDPQLELALPYDEREQPRPILRVRGAQQVVPPARELPAAAVQEANSDPAVRHRWAEDERGAKVVADSTLKPDHDRQVRLGEGQRGEALRQRVHLPIGDRPQAPSWRTLWGREKFSESGVLAPRFPLGMLNRAVGNSSRNPAGVFLLTLIANFDSEHFALIAIVQY